MDDSTLMTARITEYLSSGALFNPEQMDHDKVRDLLIDCREALAASQQEVARLKVREREALDAHSHSFGALAAISQLTKLEGEVDDYGDVVKAVAAALAEAQRHNEELTGVIETYGRVVLDRRTDSDILELRYAVSGEVFRTAGFDLFHAALRECKAMWDAKLADLRRDNRTTLEKFADAMADMERAARQSDPTEPTP